MMHEDSCEGRGAFITLWGIRADELYTAAESVWEARVIKYSSGKPIHQLYRPATLLMGLCLESLIKAYLVQRDPGLVKNGKLGEKIRSHDLNYLFMLAHFTIDKPADIQFLDRLSANVLWLSQCKFMTFDYKNKNGDISRLLARHYTDFDTFKRLYNMVKKVYHNS